MHPMQKRGTTIIIIFLHLTIIGSAVYSSNKHEQMLLLLFDHEILNFFFPLDI